MNSKPPKPALPPPTTEQSITFTRQMLGELRMIVHNEGADTLNYFIEMAYVEAGDILSGVRPLSLRGNRDATVGMAVKSAGKIKF